MKLYKPRYRSLPHHGVGDAKRGAALPLHLQRSSSSLAGPARAFPRLYSGLRRPGDRRLLRRGRAGAPSAPRPRCWVLRAASAGAGPQGAVTRVLLLCPYGCATSRPPAGLPVVGTDLLSELTFPQAQPGHQARGLSASPPHGCPSRRAEGGPPPCSRGGRCWAWAPARGRAGGSGGPPPALRSPRRGRCGFARPRGFPPAPRPARPRPAAGSGALRRARPAAAGEGAGKRGKGRGAEPSRRRSPGRWWPR